MRGLPDGSVDHVLVDPPYSKRQHASVRSAKRNTLPDGNGKVRGCNTRRVVDLGFEHFERSDCLRACYEFARLTKRWVIVFCDDGLFAAWMASAKRTGLQHFRTMYWIRIGGAPQFQGNGPSAGAEMMLLFYRPRKGHRTRWNGGGKVGLYECPIVVNRAGSRDARVHETQKPEALMVDLVRDFTDPGEVVFDPFCGSGTTGVAALKLGRRFYGFEQRSDHYDTALKRLSAAAEGQTVGEFLGKQSKLFG